MSINNKEIKDIFIESRPLFYEFLSFKSVSSQAKYFQQVMDTANWLKNYIEKFGFNNTQLLFTSKLKEGTDGFPAVYGEYMFDNAKPTIIFYGHYDVQPADEPDWKDDPFNPYEKDGRIYARGASDNKGRLWAILQALKYYIESMPDVKKKYNVKVFFEGEEEIGSKNAPLILAEHIDLLQHDLLYVNDLSQIDDQTPTLLYGLRGLVYAEVYIKTGATYAHSGHYGNLVLNASQLAGWLVFKLKDIWRNRIRIPQLYKKVRKPSKKEIEYLRSLSPNWQKVKHSSTFFVTTPYRAAKEGEFAPLHLATLRPSLDVHGIRTGVIEPEVTKTAIPYEAFVKFSLRLVPYLDPDFVAKRLEHYIASLLKRFKGVRFKVKILEKLPYFFEDPDSDIMQRAVSVIREVYKKEPVIIPAGGSIGMVSYWKQAFPDSKVILHGIASPHDRIHGSNESIKVDTIIKGMETVIRLLESDILS